MCELLSEEEAEKFKASYDVMDTDELLMIWYALTNLTASIQAQEAKNMPEIIDTLHTYCIAAQLAYEQRTGHDVDILHIPDPVLVLESAKRIAARYPKRIPSLFDEVE